MSLQARRDHDAEKSMSGSRQKIEKWPKGIHSQCVTGRFRRDGQARKSEKYFTF